MLRDYGGFIKNPHAFRHAGNPLARFPQNG